MNKGQNTTIFVFALSIFIAILGIYISNEVSAIPSTWTEPIEIYNTSSHILTIYDPGWSEKTFSMTSSENKLHILWVENSNTNCTMNYLMYNKNTASQEISILAHGSPYISNWEITYSDDTLFCYYIIGNNTNIIRSFNEGDDWTDPVIISNNYAWDSSPSIVSSKNNAYLFWTMNNTIWWVKSDDYGGNWTQPELLHTTPTYCTRVVAGLSDNYIHLVWHDHRNVSLNNPAPQIEEIYYLSSSDKGDNWSNETKLIGINSLLNPYDAMPQFVVSGKNLYLACTGEHSPIHFTRSLDNGTTWLLNDNLMNASNYFMAMTAFENQSLILRHGAFGFDCIASLDNGDSWTNVSLPNLEEYSLLLSSDYNTVYLIKEGYDENYNSTLLLTSMQWNVSSSPFPKNDSIVIYSIVAITIVVVAVFLTIFLRKRKSLPPSH